MRRLQTQRQHEMDLYKAFGIYKNEEEGASFSDSYDPIPESRGSISPGTGWGPDIPNVTPHEAADIAAQHGGGYYKADDGHQVMLRPREDGEPGLMVEHRVHGNRANRIWLLHSRLGNEHALRNRELKADEWIRHFAEHPSVTQVSPLWEERMKLYDM